MSSPKSSTSVKKSLSFSPDTKEEETDSPPKPKGIRGGGRRRKAQLALMNGEELTADDPQHAYYVLIHEDMKSAKPTASVKPIMSSENEGVGAESTVNSEIIDNRDIVGNGVTNSIASSEQVLITKKVTHVINGGQDDVALDNNMSNGIHLGTPEVSGEVKMVIVDESTPPDDVIPDEKPPLVSNNNTQSPPSGDVARSAERDWSKPKPIRGRRKKPNADMNGNEPNEPSKPEEKQNEAVDVTQELQQQKLVVANGDS